MDSAEKHKEFFLHGNVCFRGFFFSLMQGLYGTLSLWLDYLSQLCWLTFAFGIYCRTTGRSSEGGCLAAGEHVGERYNRPAWLSRITHRLYRPPPLYGKLRLGRSFSTQLSFKQNWAYESPLGVGQRDGANRNAPLWRGDPRNIFVFIDNYSVAPVD